MGLLRLFILLSAVWLTWPVQAAEPLVDAAWVKANLDTPGMVFVDVRSERAFGRGHIPGAVHTDYRNDGWRKKIDGVYGMMPAPADLEKLIGFLGIGNDSHVVLAARGKSATDMGFATRIYWTFKVLGHDKISILNGGMKAYLDDSANPTSIQSRRPIPKRYRANPRHEMIAKEADIKAALASGGAKLFDHRPLNQYLGKKKSKVVKKYGTIPGAVSKPASQLTKAGGGIFKTAKELKMSFRSASGADKGDIINFCNTGHWASLGWFVSHEILGNENARMYDGSMAEWSLNPDNPVVRQAP